MKKLLLLLFTIGFAGGLVNITSLINCTEEETEYEVFLQMCFLQEKIDANGKKKLLDQAILNFNEISVIFKNALEECERNHNCLRNNTFKKAFRVWNKAKLNYDQLHAEVEKLEESKLKEKLRKKYQ